MHISQSKAYWPYSKDTMVQLEAKTDEGKVVIEKISSKKLLSIGNGSIVVLSLRNYFKSYETDFRNSV